MDTVIREMRDVAGSSHALGMITAFLGIIAIIASLFSGITVTVLVGILVLAAGISATYIRSSWRWGTFRPAWLQFWPPSRPKSPKAMRGTALAYPSTMPSCERG